MKVAPLSVPGCSATAAVSVGNNIGINSVDVTTLTTGGFVISGNPARRFTDVDFASLSSVAEQAVFVNNPQMSSCGIDAFLAGVTAVFKSNSGSLDDTPCQ